MGGRPNHASSVLPAVAEAPLWLVWRIAAALSALAGYLVDQLDRFASRYADGDDDKQLRVYQLAATTMCALALVATAVAVYFIIQS